MITDPRLQQLETLVEDDYSKSAIVGAQHALDDVKNPLRASFLATAFRILVENTLHSQSPDEEVKLCSWYKPDPNTGGKPTRAQRAFYAVHGGLPRSAVIDVLGVDLDDMKKRLIAAIDRMGKNIHKPDETIIADVQQQDLFANDIIAATVDFFKTIKAFRKEICNEMSSAIHDAAMDAFISETIMAVDELATHHSVDEVYVGNIYVIGIDANYVTFGASGSISVVLQWGSNSDRRKGDGMEIDQSFPFTCEFKAHVDDLHTFEEGDAPAVVDTSEWTDSMRPED